MPSVLRDGPYRVYINAFERGEPAHAHVRRDSDEAKFWLRPVSVAHPGRFKPIELRRIRRILIANEAFLLEEGMRDTDEYLPAHRIRTIRPEDDRLILCLRDGRTVIVPISFYPALRDASRTEREDCHVFGDGFATEWTALDYHLSAAGIITGQREGRWYAEWRRKHPIGSEPVFDINGQPVRNVHSPRAAKRAVVRSSSALPGRPKAKPAASRTASVTSRKRKSGLKTKR